MRRATFEEREHLCRLDKKIGGAELSEFLTHICRRPRRQKELLSILFNCPGATDLPEDRIKAATRKLHERGQEMTPDEVKDELERITHKIRLGLEAQGWSPRDIPDSDRVLMEIIAHAFTETTP